MSNLWSRAEKEFGIAFDDAELSRISTVGDFYEIVLRELHLKQQGTVAPMPDTGCASSRAFYRLRKALIESGLARRKDVAPKAALESLIPRKNRREKWEEVARLMSCRLPRLERTNMLCGALSTAAAFIVLAPIVFGLVQLGGGRGYGGWSSVVQGSSSCSGSCRNREPSNSTPAARQSLVSSGGSLRRSSPGLLVWMGRGRIVKSGKRFADFLSRCRAWIRIRSRQRRPSFTI